MAYDLPEFLDPTIKQLKNRGGKLGFLDCGSFVLLILKYGVGKLFIGSLEILKFQ